MYQPPSPDVLSHGSAELRLRRIRIDVLRTELEVGLTLLDVAECTREASHRHRCVLGAIAALESASRYSGALPFQIQDVQRRYEKLRDRLLVTVNGHDPRDKK